MQHLKMITGWGLPSVQSNVDQGHTWCQKVPHSDH